jgi:hypothetical protein
VLVTEFVTQPAVVGLVAGSVHIAGPTVSGPVNLCKTMLKEVGVLAAKLT